MSKLLLEAQTVKQLMELAKEMEIVGRHKMKKPELIEAIIEIQTQKAEAEVEEKKEKSRTGGSIAVTIMMDGEVVEEFEKTYEASRWLAEKFEVKYSTVDRYLVGKSKGKEMKIPKQLVGTEFEKYEFHR